MTTNVEQTTKEGDDKMLKMLRNQLSKYHGSINELADRTGLCRRSIGLYLEGKRKKQLPLVLLKASEIIKEKEDWNVQSKNALRQSLN
jgi:hypothetical protein